MTALTTRLLTAAKRNANLVPAAGTEVLTAGNGWTVGAALTPTSDAARLGPFGYGPTTQCVAGVGANRFLRRAVGNFSAGSNTFSLFVRPTTTPEDIILRVTDTTNTINHGATFSFAAGVWTVSATENGATGTIAALPYDDGWVRLFISFTPGAPGGGATVAGNALLLEIFALTPSITFHAFGAMLQQDATTPTLPNTYMTGFSNQNSNNGHTLPILYCQRVSDESGLFQIQMLNTPVATLNLQGRMAPDAPWYTIASYPEGVLLAGTYAALVGIFPELRPSIAALGNTTTALDVWVTE